MGIIEERVKQREEYIRHARNFAECVLEKLGGSTLILHGSVAKGDFNEWSDIDVLVIIRGRLPLNPLKRLDLIYECLKLYPRIEPVLVTVSEYRRLLKKRNPLVMGALKSGIVLVDGLSIMR